MTKLKLSTFIQNCEKLILDVCLIRIQTLQADSSSLCHGNIPVLMCPGIACRNFVRCWFFAHGSQFGLTANETALKFGAVSLRSAVPQRLSVDHSAGAPSFNLHVKAPPPSTIQFLSTRLSSRVAGPWLWPPGAPLVVCSRVRVCVCTCVSQKDVHKHRQTAEARAFVALRGRPPNP